jgi:hypothetical protein
MDNATARFLLADDYFPQVRSQNIAADEESGELLGALTGPLYRPSVAWAATEGTCHCQSKRNAPESARK